MIKWLDDRLNPLLIKNLRQAVHGKFLHRTFIWTLIGATGAGLVALSIISFGAEDNSRAGRTFFMAIYLALCGAVVGLLPLTALINGDLDKSRQERLFLSPLPAAAIVRGRLLAALGQTGMVVMALLPYLSLSLLLPGIDFTAMLFVVATTLFLGVTLSAASVGISAFVSQRLMQALVTAFMAVFQFGAMMTAFTAGAEVMDRPQNIHRTEFIAITAILYLHFILISGVFLGMGLKGTVRPEENGSRGPRLFMVGMFGIGTAILYNLNTATSHLGTRDAVFMGQYISVVFGLGMIPFIYEAPVLDPQLRSQVSPSPLRAFFQGFWLPGYGRGTLLFLGVMTLWGVNWMWNPPPTSSPFEQTNFDTSLASIWRAIVFVLLPAPLLSRIPRHLASLAALPATFLFWTLLIVAAQFVDDMPKLGQNMHFFKFMSAEEGLDVLSVAAILFNLPAMIRGIAEVQQACHQRQIRESQATLKLPNG